MNEDAYYAQLLNRELEREDTDAAQAEQDLIAYEEHEWEEGDDR